MDVATRSERVREFYDLFVLAPSGPPGLPMQESAFVDTVSGLRLLGKAMFKQPIRTHLSYDTTQEND